MKINSVSCNQYFTGGLKENLRQGEAVLKEFKSEYPCIKSDTYWRQRLNKIKKEEKLYFEKYQHILYDYCTEIRYMRKRCILLDNAREEFKRSMKSYGFGNCGENSIVISEALDKKGIEHKEVCFYIKRVYSCESDHIFSVIGTKENADFTDPSSWGNNAVIIDGWMNFVLSVPDAIREYENFFMAKYNKAPFYSDFEFEVKTK